MARDGMERGMARGRLVFGVYRRVSFAFVHVGAGTDRGAGAARYPIIFPLLCDRAPPLVRSSSQ